MYLKHIEHSSENLEFYVWFKNYEAGRLTAFPEMPHGTSINGKDDTSLNDGSESSLKKKGSIEENMSQATTAEVEGQEEYNFEDSEIYASIFAFVNPGTGCGSTACSPATPKYKLPFSVVAKIDAEGKEEPIMPKTSTELITAQRQELDTIRTLFLLPGSPKELNIPSSMRIRVLKALEDSTDAKNLAPVADHCWLLLKSCSHRNFVRLGVSNGTFETVCMATGLGIVLTVAGFLCMLLLAFASPGIGKSSRWRGIGVWPMWSIGVGLILSGLRGSCFFLLLFSRRQPLPWEEFEDDLSVNRKPNGLMKFFSKLMIFDRKLKVKDDNLRRLQRKVVMQSLIGGMGFATMMVIVFLSLPIWRKM